MVDRREKCIKNFLLFSEIEFLKIVFRQKLETCELRKKGGICGFLLSLKSAVGIVQR